MITNLLSNLTSSLMKKATEMGKKIIIKKYSSGEYSPEEWDNAPSYVKQSYPRVKVVKATPKVPTTPAPVPYENQWINKIPMLPQITNAVGQVANKFNQLKPEVAKPIVDMAQKVIQPIQNAVKPFTPAPIVQKTFGTVMTAMGNNAAREQQQKQYEEDLKRRREEVLARNQGQFKITNPADVKTLQEHDNYFKAPDPVSIGMPEQVDPSKFATDPFGNKQPVFTGTDEEWNKKVGAGQRSTYEDMIHQNEVGRGTARGILESGNLLAGIIELADLPRKGLDRVRGIESTENPLSQGLRQGVEYMKSGIEAPSSIPGKIVEQLVGLAPMFAMPEALPAKLFAGSKILSKITPFINSALQFGGYNYLTAPEEMKNEAFVEGAKSGLFLHTAGLVGGKTGELLFGRGSVGKALTKTTGDFGLGYYLASQDPNATIDDKIAGGAVFGLLGALGFGNREAEKDVTGMIVRDRVRNGGEASPFLFDNGQFDFQGTYKYVKDKLATIPVEVKQNIIDPLETIIVNGKMRKGSTTIGALTGGMDRFLVGLQPTTTMRSDFMKEPTNPFSFIGPNGKNFQQYVDQGRVKDVQIGDKTFTGAEISDKNVEINTEALVNIPKGVKKSFLIRDVIKGFDEYLDNYPQLERIISVDMPELKGVTGFFTDNFKAIVFNRASHMSPYEWLQTLAHEGTHNVQSVEGWDTGSASDMYNTPEYKAEKSRVSRLMEDTQNKIQTQEYELIKLEKAGKTDTELYKAGERILSQLRDEYEQMINWQDANAPKTKYAGSIGEILPKAVGDRVNLSQEQIDSGKYPIEDTIKNYLDRNGVKDITYASVDTGAPPLKRYGEGQQIDQTFNPELLPVRQANESLPSDGIMDKMKRWTEYEKQQKSTPQYKEALDQYQNAKREAYRSIPEGKFSGYDVDPQKALYLKKLKERLGKLTPNYTKFMKNPAMNERVDPLAQEARKYPTAEEFVKAQEVIGRKKYREAATKIREASDMGDNAKFAEAQKEMIDANKLFRTQANKSQLIDIWNKAHGTPETSGRQYEGDNVPMNIRQGKDMMEKPLDTSSALSVGDRITITPKRTGVGGKEIVSPRQDVIITSTDNAEGGGQVVSYKYLDKKGNGKNGYLNTRLDKYTEKYNSNDELANRQREERANANLIATDPEVAKLNPTLTQRVKEVVKKEPENIPEPPKIEPISPSRGEELKKMIEKLKEKKTELPIQENPITPQNKKISKVAKSIELKSIEKGLEPLGELAGYEGIKRSEQAQKVKDLIDTNIDNARKIIRGEEELPQGILGGSMIVGMEKYAMAHNNFDIIQELVNSPLTAETSVHAQELGMLAERDLDSAVVAIRKANQIKKQALEEKLRGISITEAKNGEVKKLRKVTRSEPKIDEWDELINSIKCQ